jgi:HrpA-like RNA helicase
VIRYDDSLPIAAKRDEIKAALLKHQVLIIAGETGSGKPPSCRKSAWKSVAASMA